MQIQRSAGNQGTRSFPIEFDSPVRDTDTFEITLPEGYEGDDLPPPVDADFGFASYHSKTEAKGNVIGYSRTSEIKALSVPVSKAADLKSSTAASLATSATRPC